MIRKLYETSPEPRSARQMKCSDVQQTQLLSSAPNRHLDPAEHLPDIAGLPKHAAAMGEPIYFDAGQLGTQPCWLPSSFASATACTATPTFCHCCCTVAVTIVADVGYVCLRRVPSGPQHSPADAVLCCGVVACNSLIVGLGEECGVGVDDSPCMGEHRRVPAGTHHTHKYSNSDIVPSAAL